MSYADLTAEAVAALVVEVLFVAESNCTTPTADVDAAVPDIVIALVSSNATETPLLALNSAVDCLPDAVIVFSPILILAIAFWLTSAPLAIPFNFFTISAVI